MKISDVEKKINASYNTIKRFIEKKEVYNEKIDNVLHATDLGLVELEKEYGVRSNIISDDNVNYYKSQIFLLSQQLEDNKKYNNIFIKQIETKDVESENNKIRIKELEEKLHENEMEKLELKHKLELEKGRSVWSKIFSRWERNTKNRRE